MAVITFFGAKGSPGVTSTAMLVAALWPRPTLLVDADGAGGDLVTRLPSAAGPALQRTPGLLSLLPLARHGLQPSVVLDHTQVAVGGQGVLVGLETPEQADAGAALWPTLARAFRSLPGTDVVVDAGQLHARSGQLPLAVRSDLLVGVVRATPAGVVHMRRRMAALSEVLAEMGDDAPRLGVVAVEGVQQQGEASSAIATIRTEVPDVLDLGQVALDPKAERMFHGDAVARPERTMLVRSGRSLVERLVAAAGPGAVLHTSEEGVSDAAPGAAAAPADDPAATTTADEALDGPGNGADATPPKRRRFFR